MSLRCSHTPNRVSLMFKEILQLLKKKLGSRWLYLVDVGSSENYRRVSPSLIEYDAGEVLSFE